MVKWLTGRRGVVWSAGPWRQPRYHCSVLYPFSGVTAGRWGQTSRPLSKHTTTAGCVLGTQRPPAGRAGPRLLKLSPELPEPQLKPRAARRAEPAKLQAWRYMSALDAIINIPRAAAVLLSASKVTQAFDEVMSSVAAEASALDLFIDRRGRLNRYVGRLSHSPRQGVQTDMVT